MWEDLLWLVLIMLASLASGATIVFLYHLIRGGGTPMHFGTSKELPPFRPPEDWSKDEVALLRQQVHPAWTPPDVPGQCPICRALPGEDCDAGLHS